MNSFAHSHHHTMESFSHPVFVFICLLLTFSFLILPLYRKPRKRLPPGPKGIPIMGNFLQVYKKPHQLFAKLAKIHGPLMTLHLGSVTTIVASSPEMAKEILCKNNLAFSGRFITEAIAAQPDYDLALTWLPGGPRWAKLRKICTSGIFTMRKLDQLQELRYNVVDNMVKEIQQKCHRGERIFLGRLTFGVMWNMLSNSMYSENTFDDLNSRHVDEMKAHIDNIFVNTGRFNLSDYFQFLKPFDMQGIKKSIRLSYEHMHAYVDKIVDHRKRERESGASRTQDFLDVLLDLCCQENGNHELTYQESKLILAELFIAGSHTPASMVEWAMAELVRNPNIMANAKQEIASNFGKCETVREKDMAKLPYVTAIVKETMRLHGPALLLPHYSETDVELRGYYIPKHALIFVNAWAISREKMYWDEPERFNPVRFINSEYDFQGQNSSFLPFGAGRRICPGYSLGVRMVFLMIATLIHRFDWKLPDGVTPDTIQKNETLVAIPLCNN